MLFNIVFLQVFVCLCSLFVISYLIKYLYTLFELYISVGHALDIGFTIVLSIYTLYLLISQADTILINVFATITIVTMVINIISYLKSS